MSRVMIALTILALALGQGCGSDGGGNSNPEPTATPTPEPRGTASVAFDVTVGASLQAFQFRAAYPTEKGSFSGAADQVDCRTAAGQVFTKNDGDDGTLILSVASAADLTFPITITCSFDGPAGRALAAGDIGVTVDEVTADGMPGDASALRVAVHVS